jgi:hypothetical protein
VSESATIKQHAFRKADSEKHHSHANKRMEVMTIHPAGMLDARHKRHNRAAQGRDKASEKRFHGWFV